MVLSGVALSGWTFRIADEKAAQMLPYWIAATAVFAIFAWGMARRARVQASELARERRMREELEAYSALDTTLPLPGEGVDQVSAAKSLAMRVCRAIAAKSAFSRVMVLTRIEHGPLKCVGSIGVDDLTVASVERWGEQVVQEENAALMDGSAVVERSTLARTSSGMRRLAAVPKPNQPPAGVGPATKFTIELGRWREFDEEIASWKMSGRAERRQWRRALVFPVRAGILVGAIVVCLDGLQVPDKKVRLESLTSPLEMLAGRLGRAAAGLV